MQNLVIVESPTKGRTLSKYLGSKYRVEASMGHIRDLPKSDLGVDTEDNFEPRYIIPKDKLKRVNELKKIASEAKTLWLATDPDREGEAIAWHLKELLVHSSPLVGRKKTTANNERTNKLTIQRVVFHEITPEAIKEAFEKPREIDLKLVDAQQARRVLDRLVGYKLSPLLWKKIKSGLSAGRVQSVAVRLVVEREKEIEAFKPVEYWSIEAELEAGSVRGPVGKQPHSTSSLRNNFAAGGQWGTPFTATPHTKTSSTFIATLIELNGKKLEIHNEADSKRHVENLEKANYKVSKVTQKEVRRFPYPPFTTSTLQQAASNRLGFSAKKTMSVAQALYERGLITYMRTDSVNLSPFALTAARKYIEQAMGKNYLPGSARVYKTKSKVAQEAHEAIRPSDVNLTAEKLKTTEGLTRDHVRLYELIWKRMVASQMSEAVMDQTTVEVSAAGGHPERSEGSLTNVSSNKLRDSSSSTQNDNTYLLRATGSIMKFEGWLKLYGKDSEEEEKEEGKQPLPILRENEDLKLLNLKPEQHFTEHPPRYNEASLIKRLEELGIGRPSTYAPTLSTIQERFYVERKERRYYPTELGVAVTTFLTDNFSNIVDYAFTAQMEDALDEVAAGEREWRSTVGDFYKPFEAKVEKVAETAQKVEIETEVTDKTCPKCGKNLVVRFGRFGKFLACSGFPDCKYTENLEQKVEMPCPDCGGEILVKRTRKGRPFYGCKNWPTCKFASWTKPQK